MSVDKERIKSICEALIFVSEEALPFRRIQAILEGVPRKELQDILTELIADWQTKDIGFILEEVAEGYQFRTRPENTEWIKRLVKFKPQKLSKPALETLAIVAYNQPTTKTDVEAIRAVDCSSSLSQLLEKGLIKILGRKEVPGKPFIYGTTRKFLEVMGLKDLSSLPTLREIEESEIIQMEGLEELSDEDDEEYAEELKALEQSKSEVPQQDAAAEFAEPPDMDELLEEPDDGGEEADIEQAPEPSDDDGGDDEETADDEAEEDGVDEDDTDEDDEAEYVDDDDDEEYLDDEDGESVVDGDDEASEEPEQDDEDEQDSEEDDGDETDR